MAAKIPIDEELLKKLYFEGKSYIEISKVLNICYQTVANKLEKFSWFQENRRPKKIKGHLAGTQHGLLYVVEDSGQRKNGSIIYRCICSCTNKECFILGSRITYTDQQSCGCLNKTGNEHINGKYWTCIVSRAKKAGFKLNITLEYITKLFFEQNERCALSMLKLTLPGYKNTKKVTASLDRISSKRGYIIGNVQWVHKDINWMKNEFTQKEFINYCIAVSNTHGYKF